MDVISEHIVGRQQGRGALLQPRQRQALARVNARYAQNCQGGAGPHGPGPQHAFGIDAPPGPRIVRLDWARFIDQRAAAVAIHARGAHINHARAVG